MRAFPFPERGRLTAVVVAIAAAAGGALAPSHAADAGALPPLPALEPSAPSAPSVGAGWYLRGDLGYSSYGAPDAVARSGAASAILAGEEIDPGVALGLGAGYRFSPWLRVDVTVDHRTGSNTTLFSGGPAPGARGTVDLSATAALANLYLDLGAWSGFTPYVGAGIGYAWTALDGYAVTGCPAPCLSGGVDLTAPALSTDRSVGDVAYALMAGVSVDAGRSLSVDLGYRYLSFGGARLGDGTGATIETGRLGAHEARVGVRWRFGDAPHAHPISRAY